MSRRPTARTALTALLLTLGCSLAAVSAAGAVTTAATNTPVVKVADNYFAPASGTRECPPAGTFPCIKIKRDSKVKFKWSPENIETHDVALKKGPNGAKKKDFESGPARVGYRFTARFEKPGTYDLLCTLHPDVMQIEVKVKR